MEENTNIPEEYKPMSVWGYVGYMFLFAIPCIGFILMIVFAVSGKTISLKNFARAYLVLYCIVIILYIILIILAVTGVLVSNSALTNSSVSPISPIQ